MICPHCIIAYSPNFIALYPEYDVKTELWSKIYSQFCPKCHQYVIGIYQFKTFQGRSLTKDNYEENLMILVPVFYSKYYIPTFITFLLFESKIAQSS